MGQEATRLDNFDDRDVRAVEADSTPEDTDEIEREIEQTRAEMSETIDEIQARLNPDVLKEQAKEAAKDAAYDQTIGRVVDAKDSAVEKVQELAGQTADKVRGLTGGSSDDERSSYLAGSPSYSTSRSTGTTIIETIREHPIPAAIAGAGLGWFLTSRSSRHEVHDRRGYMRNTMRTGNRGQQMDYRSGYGSWDRRQPDPGHLREYDDGSFRSQMTSTGNDVVGFIQRNPIPAALAGLGIGLAVMRNRRSGGDHEQPYYYQPGRHTTMSEQYGYRGGQTGWQRGYDTQGYRYQSPGYQAPGYQASGYQTSGYQQAPSYGYQGERQHSGSEEEGGRMSEMAGTVQERAGGAMHQAQEMGSQAMDQVSHFGSMAQERVSDLPHRAQHQYYSLRSTLDQRMHESPLMMGVVAMGVGLAVGMLLPETQKENEVFGERRDQLMEQAQEKAGEAVGRAQEVAKDVVHAAQETVQEAAQQGDSNSQSSSSPA